ncbi:hypothetical protein CPB84DRAFT_1818238 [Gymnopilus junonius]|uniref:DNA breaking-rejoining enzyme n=1 Tax=Gymnopilus junonius TaxID=109634 RepID=A0A9P5N8W6_GYMJU|nr:hypothetical protein CPB84DRAFT_1818238 [Gymnopilus junonius]
MTYLFGCTLSLGSHPWQKSEVSGKMSGNPSISEQVSSYMMSLQTRKETLKKLYDKNNKPQNSKIKDYEPSSWLQAADIDDWGGGMTRITLFLEFRKTHCNGGIKPFRIYPLPWDEAHLCPVHALGEWMKASKITSGYIFQKIASGDRPDADDKPMTSEQFLELFHNNLLDVGVDPIPYGTHSFRRGGCQYLSSLCNWGGWSTEFSNLTIVRYLISWNDDPTDKREDYFNPAQQPAVKCFQCRRSCHCA